MTDVEDDPEPAATVAATSEGLPDHYFELFTLTVEMADRISARRGVANGFFLTINTGLVALVGSAELRWYVAAAGVTFSATWWVLLKSYRRLNAAKFEVITEMEEQLPRQVFADEYRHYSGGASAPPSEANRRDRLRAWTEKYRELGEVERVVPVVFALIYLVEIARQALT